MKDFSQLHYIYKIHANVLQLRIIDKAKISIPELMFSWCSCLASSEQMRHTTGRLPWPWWHSFFWWETWDLTPVLILLASFLFHLTTLFWMWPKEKMSPQLAFSTSVFPDDTVVNSLWGTYPPFLKFKASKGFSDHQQPFQSLQRLLKCKYKLIIKHDRLVHAAYSEKRERPLNLVSLEWNRSSAKLWYNVLISC